MGFTGGWAPQPQPTRRPPALPGQALTGSLSVLFHPEDAKLSATVGKLEALSPGGLHPLPVTGHLCSPVSLEVKGATGLLKWGCQEDSTRCSTKNKNIDILSAFCRPVCLLAPLSPPTKA